MRAKPKGSVPNVTIEVIGQKLDDEKPRYDLIPWEALDEVVAVLSFGAKKYQPENWRHVPEPRRRYVAAALRHISASMRGEKFDEQSKRSHLAHAVCSLMFALELEE